MENKIRGGGEVWTEGKIEGLSPTEMDTGRWWAVKSVVTRAWIVQKEEEKKGIATIYNSLTIRFSGNNRIH